MMTDYRLEIRTESKNCVAYETLEEETEEKSSKSSVKLQQNHERFFSHPFY